MLLAIGTVVAVSSIAAAEPWHAPRCAAVRGTDLVTFSVDGGRTLAPTRRAPGGLAYTLGLVALSRPNALLAVSDGTVLRSDDAGCAWRALGRLPSASGHPVWRLASAPNGVAFAWYENEPSLWRIEGAHLRELRGPSAAGLIGLAAARGDRRGLALRAVDAAGVVWTSRDGGGSWERSAALALGRDALLYRAAFAPGDLDRILLSLAGDGAYATTDGGATWTKAVGLSATGGPVNVFEAVVSPRDPRLVWAMGLDLDEADAGAPSGGRHLYRSLDGGLHFAPVVDASRRVTLRNGPLLAADPADPAVLYFVFGTSYADYGTDLFRYDAHRDTVSRRHFSYDDFGALAFSPAAPGILYIGIVSERGIQ